MTVVATQGYTGLHIPSQLPIIAVHRARNSPSRAEWYRSENERVVVARNSKSKSSSKAAKTVVPLTDLDGNNNYHDFRGCCDEISLGNRLRCEKIGRLECIWSGHHSPAAAGHNCHILLASDAWFETCCYIIATVETISPFRTDSYCNYFNSWHAFNNSLSSKRQSLTTIVLAEMRCECDICSGVAVSLSIWFMMLSSKIILDRFGGQTFAT